MVFTTCVFAVVVIVAVLALGGTGMCTDGARLRERKLAQWGVRREWATRVGDVRRGGDVKLAGTVVADDGELRAPFSGRRCIAYELTLFDFDGVRPVLLAREAVARSFVLRDDTGSAHVMPEPVFVGIEPDKRWRFEPPQVDRRIAAILARHAVARPWRGHAVVVCEGVIPVGGPVAVFGHASDEPFADTGTGAPYRSLGTRPLLTGSPAAPLLLIPDD